MSQLFPAYWFTCHRCRHTAFVSAHFATDGVLCKDFPSFRSEFITQLVEHHGVSQVEILKEADQQIRQLRMSRFNLSPIGFNVEVIGDNSGVNCCDPINLSQILESHLMHDAGHWDCIDCNSRNYCKYELIEEHSTKNLKDKTQEFTNKLQKCGLPTALAAVAGIPRVIVCSNTVILLDRITKVPIEGSCKFCSKKTKLKLVNHPKMGS